MIIATIPGNMYRSAVDGAVVDAGDSVGCADITLKDVIDDDGQYALVPPKLAITV